ncbi:MAG: hypothetical protein QM703_13855 [Gemmatales bacterium]
MFAILVMLSLPPLEQPAVKYVGVVNKHGGQWLSLQVENPNDNKAYFYGYTPESYSDGIPQGEIRPLYVMEMRSTKSPWKPVELGHCATGRGVLPLEPRTKVTFEAIIPDGKWTEVRVGLAWTKDPKAPGERVWSESLKRADLNKKP